MILKNIKSVYFIGIGGIGMSALARYFKAKGLEVSGYDKSPSTLTAALECENIKIHYEDNLKLVDRDLLEADEAKKAEILIVYTPAVPQDHQELQYFLNKQYVVKKRAAVLGIITERSFTLAVAGTHGKTTTSTMLAHFLTLSNQGCNAFLGGIAQNYNTNLLINGSSSNTVVEADEYDRSFLSLSPDISIITSMDADHLDIYGDKKAIQESFILFALKLKSGGKLIYKNGLPLPETIVENGFSYSSSEQADFYASNIRVEEGKFVFDFKSHLGDLNQLSLSVPGRHNVENCVAALAAAQLAGVGNSELAKTVASFKGVKRRFEYILKSEKVILIDDYAHHPEEIKACLSAIKELYPEKKITGVFQPHLYSRTRDFATEFASSLDLLDECLLLPIYPAREAPIKGITSQIVLDKMKLKKKESLTKEELVLAFESRHFELVVLMGAGDIDGLIEPIKEALTLFNLK